MFRWPECKATRWSNSQLASQNELRLDNENSRLRQLLAQAGIDAAEQRVLDGLQRLLLEELHHRIKNVLAIVAAITSQSLRNAGSLEEGRVAIEYRLLALGRVHDLLLKTKWTSAKLEAIVYTAIEAFNKGTAFIVEVPDIDVSPSAVLPLTMTINELCTNAVKYGALSGPGGCVAITAFSDVTGMRFHFTWSEIGGPVVRSPTHQGFGTRLIEQGFVGELRGEAHLSFEPSGVVCKLDIPLASIAPG
jgi:two-component sensor histidine kinase